MASPDKKDEAQKYDDWSLDELQEECRKRKIQFTETSKNSLIDLLVKDDRKPPDWGKIYSQLLYHYKMDYDSIRKRTLPQLAALNQNLPEQIQISQLCIPDIFGGVLNSEPTADNSTGKAPTLSEFKSLAACFNGI